VEISVGELRIDSDCRREVSNCTGKDHSLTVMLYIRFPLARVEASRSAGELGH
jgi:hypothetical protein